MGSTNLIEMFKKTLGQRKWFWPLLGAVVLLGLDLAGIQVDQQTLVATVVLLLGSTAGESLKDFMAMLTPLFAALRKREPKAIVDELLELKEELDADQIEALRGLMSEITSSGEDG